MTSIVDYETAHFRLITLTFAGNAVCDVMITVGLVYNLGRHRRKSGFPRTVRQINRLILWTLETGLIKGLTSILIIVFFFTMRQTSIWAGVYMYFTCIYTNSLLALLNNRIPPSHFNQVYELPRNNSPSTSLPKTHSVIIDISRTAENDAADKTDMTLYNLESQESDVKV
ncbi:hypothetical protein BJ138DRAFT_169056 [Hygrophoropsis aurantiaca]|uniref:Uncharacterized protein n=1 Tax=Hygrophoropsis aurantiaca TaxID=72124 RepID=A0ACB8AA17_9AGAM|nr:hypothetical protein BJ138DRAFT_169056 [Hygrophoropsis aurantiaca]